MIKLQLSNLSDFNFDDFKFEKELISESFYTEHGKSKIILKCVVKPITNKIEYIVLIQYTDFIIKKFALFGDAIYYYNNKLEELNGEKELI